MTVYESGIGDPLLQPQTHNYNIRNYLSEEHSILSRCLHKFDCVMELGCSDGRHTAQVLADGKQYIGIDNVSRYIETARRRFARHATQPEFIVDDIKNFVRHMPTQAGKMLMIFPFNIIGNLPNAEEILTKALKMSDGVIVFGYKNDFHTQSVRNDYYNSAGFEDITCITNKDGVRFTDKRGLNTIAYSEQWFHDIFNEHYEHCHHINFGNIGVAYANFNI
ncbi:MAG: class I SAM-dependent methyltransferase [Chitinophagales bacterium]|nr:class I SAM-dependent methyltransferase [Chitinophagales bacterium]